MCHGLNLCASTILGLVGGKLVVEIKFGLFEK